MVKVNTKVYILEPCCGLGGRQTSEASCNISDVLAGEFR
jgi:hypothetical protein